MEKENVMELTEKQDKWRGEECLNMIASENLMSPLAKKVYLSDFMHRYAEGEPFKRYYQGTNIIDKIESEAIELVKQVFMAEQADLRPISGATANIAAFSGLLKHGDTIMSPGLSGGSHITHEKFGSAGAVLGLRTEHLVFNPEEYDFDIDACISKIKEVKPQLVTLGGSVIIFPHPVKELKVACNEVGARLLYDGAHVLGLIAAGKFQMPLKEGAEILTASTHKTFPGPQGGIILGDTDKETWKTIKRKIFPGLFSNHHLHRLPAMYITLLETQEYGHDYANQIISNAKALGEAMHELGFDVIAADKGFTESHQILVDVRKQGNGAYVAETLEKADIILNKNVLAWEGPESTMDPSGLRIGVQELTRIGMKEGEMKHVAELIKKVIIDKKDPAEIAKEVIEFRQDFQKIKYCFEE